MNNRGQIKVADFGMARFVGDPPPQNLTQLVVTLWYRAPELLLGATTYDYAVDVWSLGCIFGELLAKQPLLQGKNEVGQLTKVSIFLFLIVFLFLFLMFVPCPSDARPVHNVGTWNNVPLNYNHDHTNAGYIYTYTHT